MPHIHQFNSGGTISLAWNVDVPVGVRGVSVGLNVKLVQYLLFRAGLGSTAGSFLAHDRVNGVWDPPSSAALKRFEKSLGGEVVADGRIDPMRPGQRFGSISKKRYKIGALNGAYLRSVTGLDTREAVKSATLSANDLNEILMRMPQNDDMPRDLQVELLKVRATAGVP